MNNICLLKIRSLIHPAFLHVLFFVLLLKNFNFFCNSKNSIIGHLLSNRDLIKVKFYPWSLSELIST